MQSEKKTRVRGKNRLQSCFSETDLVLFLDVDDFTRFYLLVTCNANLLRRIIENVANLVSVVFEHSGPENERIKALTHS